MSQPPRRPASAARYLGDDYQHLLTWLYAAQLLRRDPEIVRIEMEKPQAGNVDDFVVHRTAGRPEYHQVKFSTKPAGDPLNAAWFTAVDARSKKSPLQRFHASWLKLTSGDERPRMVLYTNRNPAEGDPAMACLDGKTELLVPELTGAGARSDRGKLRATWADHLGVNEDELLEMLANLRIRAAQQSIDTLREHCRWVMEAVGLASDDQSIDQGMLAVRRWIENAVLEVVAEAVAELVERLDLRAGEERATVLIQALGHDPLAELATVSLDWVDEFEGIDPRERRRPRDENIWGTRFEPELREAEKTVRSLGYREVRFAGAFRLTTAVFAGTVFSAFAPYEVVIEGITSDRTVIDIGSAGSSAAPEIVISEHELTGGDELAIGLSVTADVTSDVLAHISAERLPAGRFVNLALSEPGRSSLADAAAMRGWAELVSDQMRAIPQRDTRLVHLFIAVPRPAALLLGHQWNRMPPTQLWEEDPPGGYFRSFRLR